MFQNQPYTNSKEDDQLKFGVRKSHVRIVVPTGANLAVL